MRALITGVNGQDGSYLAEQLLEEGCEVHGVIRRASLPNLGRIEHLRDRVSLHYGDLADGSALTNLVYSVQPDEVYNLGALSDVGVSFAVPEYSGDITGLGATRLLEAIRLAAPRAHFYQAGSSEMFGMNPDVPTHEASAFFPGSPYAVAKVYAHHMTTVYRESYGLHASNGILFNHESERRGADFVTRKITLGIAAICRGQQDKLRLGNLNALRDWGYAPDYMRAVRAITRTVVPGDYVVATGETHSVKEFLERAFEHVDLDWHDYVIQDARLFRPMDPPVLRGDAGLIAAKLGWKPEVEFDELVRRMVDADLRA